MGIPSSKDRQGLEEREERAGDPIRDEKIKPESI